MGTLSTHSELCSATLTERAGCWAKQGRTCDHITFSFLFHRPRHVPEAGQLNLDPLPLPQLRQLAAEDYDCWSLLRQPEGPAPQLGPGPDVCDAMDMESDAMDSESKYGLFNDDAEIMRQLCSLEHCLFATDLSLSNTNHILDDVAILLDASPLALARHASLRCVNSPQPLAGDLSLARRLTDSRLQGSGAFRHGARH